MTTHKLKNIIPIIELAKLIGCQVSASNYTKSIYKEESNPSLKFYPETNSYYCFATGIGGDLIKFYADFSRITTKQAINELEEKYMRNKFQSRQSPNCAVKVKSKQDYKHKVLESEKDIFEERAAIIEYEGKLSKTIAEKRAWEDLLARRKETQTLIYESLEKFCFGLDEQSFEYLNGPERGLSPETIKRFRLFYIYNDTSVNSYLQDCFSPEDLFLAGLYSKQGKFLFSNHKIIIPFVENGKVVYLRGRYFQNGYAEPKGIGKYIGPHNFATNLSARRFYNSDILKCLKKDSTLFICEGEFDTMIADQIGNKAIGINGVNNFPQHLINHLESYQIILAFDNDAAGEKAVKEIAQLFQRKLKVLKINNYKDLTELVINEYRN